MSNFKIDLNDLFKKLESKSTFCVMKLPDNFPNYNFGLDLDFFCYDCESIASEILSYLQNFINESININVTNKNNQINIKLISSGKINITFDLHSRLPSFKKILIKESFFSSIIENSELIRRGRCKVRIPSQIDENIIRYIEYHEYYGFMPDKLKHIDYIQEKLKNSKVDLVFFFDKLHFYTEFPKTQYDLAENQVLKSLSQLIFYVKIFFQVISQKGLKQAFKLAIKKLRE